MPMRLFASCFPRLRSLLLFVGLLGLGALPAGAQITTLAPPDSVEALGFGESVDIDGNYAVIGAPSEQVCGIQSGAAYLYERDPEWGQWTPIARLTPTPCRENAFFGSAVSLQDDRVLIGASSEFFADPQSNAAFVFERRSDSTWTQTAMLTGDVNLQEGPFGADLALSGDRAFVSTTGDFQGRFDGSVYVFRYDAETDQWQREARLTSDRDLGRGVLGGSLAVDGTRVAVAASTYFARQPGAVHLFERPSTASPEWTSTAILAERDDFFLPLDLHGDQLIVGESRAESDNSGRATLYNRAPTGAWRKTAVLRPDRPFADGAFGSAVAIEEDWALVTGYDEQLRQDVNIDRVVYTFQRDDEGTWHQRRFIDVGRIDFGAALALDNGIALIGWVPPQGEGLVYSITLQ